MRIFSITNRRMASIEFNSSVKIIISDVDETIADLYVSAEEEMCKQLESLLRE